MVYLLGVRKQVIGPMASTNAKEVRGPMAGWVTKRTCIFANEQLAGLFPDDGNLLIACVKIATYNLINIARLLSSEPWSSNRCQVYSGEGADAVI